MTLEKVKEKMGEWWQSLSESLGEEARLRMGLAVLAGVAAVLLIFAFAEEDTDNAPAGQDDLPMVAAVNNPPGDKLEIIGSQEAAGKEPLRNPFLPEHPVKGQAVAAKAKPEVTAGAVGGKMAKALPVTVPAVVQPGQSGQPQANQRQVYLQGIIDMDGTLGALLTMDGKSRFLLAGESWQGYVVDSLEKEQAVVNGRAVQVGDTVAF